MLRSRFPFEGFKAPTMKKMVVTSAQLAILGGAYQTCRQAGWRVGG